MTVTERFDAPAESHFTEGEPDLEPPEELAIAELDDQAVLEEELDNEDLLEQDVDEDTLEAALEDLVHGGADVDDDPDDDVGHLLEPDHAVPQAAPGAASLPEADDEVENDDVEEGLDDVLRVRLALGDAELDRDPGDDGFGDLALADVLVRTRLVTTEVAPCGSDEFVCRSCFLVRSRAQLCDPVAVTCRDCSD